MAARICAGVFDLRLERRQPATFLEIGVPETTGGPQQNSVAGFFDSDQDFTAGNGFLTSPQALPPGAKAAGLSKRDDIITACLAQACDENKDTKSAI